MSDSLNALQAAIQSEQLLDVSNQVRTLLAQNAPLGVRWAEVAGAALTAGDEVSALKAAEKLSEAAPQSADSWLWVASVHSALGSTRKRCASWKAR
jgi:hypothetical protein